MKKYKVYFQENLEVLKKIKSGTIDLIYIDPPFNTRKTQSRTRIRVVRSASGDRKGFNGNQYETIKMNSMQYGDSFGEKYKDFIYPRLEEAYRILSPTGSLYFHIDYREVHYCKIWLDEIFSDERCFMNEIIWAYDYGGKPKNKWPAKHDNILFYVKDPLNYKFHIENVDREPYMAPGLVGEEKVEKGKLPTDTWWHTIVPTNGDERTGYPTQKPLGVINRIIRTSSNKDDLILDFFAGSGTVGESCLKLGRNFILIDNNKDAIDVMYNRFSKYNDFEKIKWINYPDNS